MDAEIRDRRTVVLSRTSATESARYDHWIGGRAVAPASDSYIRVANPSSRTDDAEVADGSLPDVDRAVRAARIAQQDWAEAPPGSRADVLAALADAITAHAPDLCALECESTGKTRQQSEREVALAADYFDYYGGVIRSLRGAVINVGASSHVFTQHVPYGVTAIITPWNAALNQACRSVAPALAAGNTAVLKPSEFTSGSTRLFAQLASEAGLPDGVLNVVLGTGDAVGLPLVKHAGVRNIVFTGSLAVGRILGHVAAERVVPITLELGGKSPLVIFADADLERAAATAAAAAATNTGQVCSATTRLLVEESVHDELVDRVARKLEALRPGVDFGPIVTEAQFQRILQIFVGATQEGARLVVGGVPYEDGTFAAGRFVRPTVYANVSRNMRVYREEIFGPVLVTIAFASESDAIDMANDSEYGLAASVWSGDVARAMRVANRIDAGQVSINGGTMGIEAPFGGFKNSGIGREKGLEALLEYTQVKTVSVGLSGGRSD